MGAEGKIKAHENYFQVLFTNHSTFDKPYLISCKMLKMESKKHIFFTIIAFVSVFQTVRAMECFDCKSGTTCKSIEEMQEKTTCLSGSENCQTVETSKKGKVVSVTGGCCCGP